MEMNIIGPSMGLMGFLNFFKKKNIQMCEFIKRRCKRHSCIRWLLCSLN